MNLTTVLLLLKLLTVYVEPENGPKPKDDAKLAACAVQLLTKQPSALKVVTDRSEADVALTLGNHAAHVIRVDATLTARDGAVLATVGFTLKYDPARPTFFTRPLCQQAEGAMDALAESLRIRMNERPLQ
jgi:hypothetical protein